MASEIPDLPGLADLHPLGRGGFADVYRGRQAHLDRFVAAKVFRVTLADRSASDQFRAECQALGRLDGHPNLIKVYNADVLVDGRPYILTEACDTTLQKALERRGPLPPAEVAELGLTLARALLFAHSERVLHGDVTPQNVLLRATGAPVLADFGLAVLRDYRGNVATGFTMTHAAPETVRYDGAIDERTDVYGLGSTLYTLLTGSPPIVPRPRESDPEYASRVLTETPPRAGGPAWLADLLERMLAKEPATRPSMTQVADALAAGDSAAPAVPPPPSFSPPPDAPVFTAPPDSPWAPRPDTGSSAQGGTGPSWSPPPAPVWAPGAGEETRLRAGQAAGLTPPPAHGGGPGQPVQDQTRLRAGAAGARQGTAKTTRPRWPIPVAAGAIVVIAAAAALYLGLRPGSDAPVAPGASTAPAAPAATGAHIELATPVDNGDTVVLTWSVAGGQTLDYAVLVGQPGAPPATNLVGRVNTYSVSVQPGTQYCFQVQGSTQAGTVSESNVQPVRNAVCRFRNS